MTFDQLPIGIAAGTALSKGQWSGQAPGLVGGNGRGGGELEMIVP